MNRPMDDINPSDVTVAYVSVINISTTIKCLGYIWLGNILLVNMVGIPADQNSFKMEVHMEYMKPCILNIG